MEMNTKPAFLAPELELVPLAPAEDIITTSDNGGGGNGIVLPIDEW